MDDYPLEGANIKMRELCKRGGVLSQNTFLVQLQATNRSIAMFEGFNSHVEQVSFDIQFSSNGRCELIHPSRRILSMRPFQKSPHRIVVAEEDIIFNRVTIWGRKTLRIRMQAVLEPQSFSHPKPQDIRQPLPYPPSAKVTVLLRYDEDWTWSSPHRAALGFPGQSFHFILTRSARLQVLVEAARLLHVCVRWRLCRFLLRHKLLASRLFRFIFKCVVRIAPVKALWFWYRLANQNNKSRSPRKTDCELHFLMLATNAASDLD